MLTDPIKDLVLNPISYLRCSFNSSTIRPNSFLRPFKISMVNQTFYKYSLFLLYNIHLILKKVILILMLKKKL
ncbi:hypothetical protein BpHYR1_033886 [Brachionus plicatilis]|uniref:Uncharacterized protein n=1 Tax=Brachionus plicatilis TaxID=10195 RepID=A0A3M7S694_BRAPC|nr:hypothetical protein BpHYR1_033886 [Brachionus plicatilis]